MADLINDFFQQSKGDKITDYNFPILGQRLLNIAKEEIKKKDEVIKSKEQQIKKLRNKNNKVEVVEED